MPMLRLKPTVFFDRIEFRTKLIPYAGDDSWVEPVLTKMKQCLEDDNIPPVGVAVMGGACDFCSYAKTRTELTINAINAKKKLKTA